ncbi:AAA family ATPase [Anabaena sp. FACHB-1237]|uniref:MinD/ParA family ATP-binding protein n=1 Tax=Anabaena sp. FACHB-1237 TaxID=2692769 RepID=UPI001681470D|nr:AAA family ATPase [Anabaena sp. FACHB-1237]MBD2137997.1 AAA family ATPase [Anabaena sp. FACHB-1237]
MAKIISFYSFRDGTGKTTITANVAAAIAEKYKKKVAIVDTNFAAPGLHHFFPTQDLNFYLNNYLNKEGNILKTIADVGASFGLPIKLIPASGKIGDIITTTSQEIDYKHLCQGLKTITKQENEDQIDYLLIDCSPGIQEANLLIMSISDMVLISLRENQQDWQETFNSLEIIKTNLKLTTELVINQAISENLEELKNTIQRKYQTIVMEILPQCQELMEFSTPSTPKDSSQSRLYYRENPENNWSRRIGAIADKIVKINKIN